MATVTILQPKSAPKASPCKRRITKAAWLRRHAPAAVILVLLYLSLSHLAHGVSIVTDARRGKAWQWRSGSTC
jgi:hypothetical protein